jgi:hypothetical protein
LNTRPTPYQDVALPTELQQRKDKLSQSQAIESARCDLGDQRSRMHEVPVPQRLELFFRTNCFFVSMADVPETALSQHFLRCR